MFDELISVASWEPRFLTGIRRLLAESPPARGHQMFFMDEYAGQTANVRDEAEKVTRDADIEFLPTTLHFSDPAGSWSRIGATIRGRISADDSVLLDITTMPREVIWAALFWLEQVGARVQYAYHKPGRYADGPLAWDPNEPRFAFKLAGLPALGRPIALLAATGYDTDRVRQAIDYYEPNRTVLAVQIGKQFDNLGRNLEAYAEGDAFARYERVEIDAYDFDHGYETLAKAVDDLATDHNVVLCSFGPKLSALPLYRIQRQVANAALSYIHCKQYCDQYSYGIGETVVRSLAIGDGSPE